MIFTRIWQRYLLKEIFKIFSLFLGCFFFLYSLIDYSLHMQDFIVDKTIQVSHIITYYLFQFIKRASLLLPLSLLIATLKTLFTMNAKGELIALQASGLSLRKILSPFFFLATLSMLFNLISSEWILPSSLNYLDQFRENHFKHSHRGNRKEPIHVLTLKDRSKIIYRLEDREKKLFCDVFWVRSSDEIWRMQSLSSDPKQPIGFFVDHLLRNPEGYLEKQESFDTYHFSDFKWEKDRIGKGQIPLENRKISQLYRLLFDPKITSNYERGEILTHLLFKCMSPLISFIVILAAAPFCLKHSRQLPIFFTYTICLFGFVAFFALMDAAVILGENQVLPPSFSILFPVLVSLFGFGYYYQKYLRNPL